MEIPADLKELAARQSGVVTRAQLRATGFEHHDVRRLLRWRLLVPMAHGVFLNHTGTPTWDQQAWAAVLGRSPAALDGMSALRAAGMRVSTDSGPIHVAIDARRRVATPAGVRVRRVAGLEDQVLWNASPPRMRVEPALLHVAAHAPDDLRAVGLLTDAVSDRLTTPDLLLTSLRARGHIRRRDVIHDVLEGLRQGADSVLEQAYLRRVERAHRLPAPARQARLAGSDERRDLVHEAEQVVIELDGRAYHSLTHARFTDLERDLTAAESGHVTLRLGWGQVVGTPCTTAARVAALLQRRGWEGAPVRCARCG